jgi:putative N6-adenine-specific DNA methylase
VISSTLFVAASRDTLPFLRVELTALGYRALSEGMSGVNVAGGMDDAMRLNLHLRTAHRVLFLLGEFKAGSPQDLYRETSRVRWEDIVPENGYVCVTSVVDSTRVKDSRFANLRCKDAVVDRLRKRTGKRPDSGPSRRGTVVHLYWKEDKVWLYLDTSGETLSRRGYRHVPFEAPMRETLAASLILATGWDPKSGHFVNPMCGSGTLAIEAALMALNRAPGIRRESFGFMHLKGFDRKLWERMKREAVAKERASPSGRILATDISRDAVEAAHVNAREAGVERFVEILRCDFRETPVPGASPVPGTSSVPGASPVPEGAPTAVKGVVILNPEYGVRMGEGSRLEEVYSGIGDFFKTKCSGYRGYVFSGNLPLLKKVGLRTSRRLTFHNADIECRLGEYELYTGSRKARFREAE